MEVHPILSVFKDRCPVFLAPMVELGDLAFRLLVRRYGVSICWTGMINSNQWNMSKTYRQSILQLKQEDHPLVCQISGSIDSDLVSTAISLCDLCEAIDLNLGCCQKVAKRGSFGYFLVDTEKKRMDVIDLVTQITTKINKPLFVKIRALSNANGEVDPELTSEFASALQKAGASLISVHGRPAIQDKAGPLHLAVIKAVVSAVTIPVIANGGIQTLDQANQIVLETGASGVMIGQALLQNPTVFQTEKRISRFEFSREYLSIYEDVGGAFEAARRHMFYFFDNDLGTNGEMRKRLGTCKNIEEIKSIINDIEAGIVH